jgi:endoglucanase
MKRNILLRLSLPAFCLFVPVVLMLGEQTFSDPPETKDSAGKMELIRVDGNQFVDENGEPFVFRGLALSDPYHLLEQGVWGRAYFEKAKEWNANVVRIPVHPAWMRELGIERYLELLDEAVGWCESLGLYVIIDWHLIGNPDNWIPHRDIYRTTREETFYFWYRIANRFSGHPTVAVYELYNEPTNFGGRMGRLEWETHRNLMEELIDMIFAIDPTAIPAVAGFNWGYDLSHVRFEPVRYEGVAYVTHPYPQKREQPWMEQWYQDWGFAAQKYPILATEFGFMSEDEEGAHIPCLGDESYGEAIIEAFEQWGVSWTVWVFDAQWTPRLIEDWDYTPSRQGRFFKKCSPIWLNKSEKADSSFQAAILKLSRFFCARIRASRGNTRKHNT